MNPIRRALIVDDEPDARASLRKLIAGHPEVEIVGEADSVTEAITQFHVYRPNLIFLDVQMPKRDGFSLLPELQPVPDIIFTTAYDAFAVKAFEVNAVDYLMKPIHPERLQLALARISRPAKRQAEPFSSDDHIFLRSDLEMRVVLASNISHIEADGNYSRVHIAYNGSMFVRRKMREWFNLLPANIFSRVHRSLLINLWTVRDIIPEPHEHARVSFVGSESPIELTRRGARRLRQAMQDIAGVQQQVLFITNSGPFVTPTGSSVFPRFRGSMKRNLNIIGPQIRRLRNAMGWSQNYFAIKLQLLGMEAATRKKVAKIESREVWVSDDDLLFISRGLRVDLSQLFPPKILGARHLYHAICEAKESRFGCLIAGLFFCPELGAGVLNFASIVSAV